jgi:hypothetical protein
MTDVHAPSDGNAPGPATVEDLRVEAEINLAHAHVLVGRDDAAAIAMAREAIRLLQQASGRQADHPSG